MVKNIWDLWFIAELYFKSCEIRLVFDVSEMDNVLEHMIHIGYYSKLL